MNIPNKVKIGWKHYDVEQKEIDSSLVSDYTELFGQVFFGEQKIFINQSYDAGQRECTLLHESIHAMDDMCGIGLQEDQVKMLGHAMYAFIRDNPGVFDSGGDALD